MVTDADRRVIVESAIRKIADLADVMRATAIASRLSAETLEGLVNDLMRVVVATREEPSISFTPAKVEALRLAYQRAVENGNEQFEFEGHELLTKYARYLLEYIEQQLER